MFYLHCAPCAPFDVPSRMCRAIGAKSVITTPCNALCRVSWHAFHKIDKLFTMINFHTPEQSQACHLQTIYQTQHSVLDLNLGWVCHLTNISDFSISYFMTRTRKAISSVWFIFYAHFTGYNNMPQVFGIKYFR